MFVSRFSVPSFFLLPSLPLILFLSFPSSFVSAATCQPSLTTICVSHDGFQFVLEGGISNHAYIGFPAPKPPLTLFQGQTYAFELTENGDFTTHPLVLTSDSTGACQDNCPLPQVGLLEDGDETAANGAIIANQAGSVIHFTAQNSDDVGEELYYQCQHHPNMGNEITIADANNYTINNLPSFNSSLESSSSSTGTETNTTTPNVFVNQTEIYNGSSTGYVSYLSSTGSNGGNVGGGSTGGGGGGGVVVSSTGIGGGGGGNGGSTGPISKDPNGVVMKSSVNWIVGGMVTFIVAVTVNLL